MNPECTYDEMIDELIRLESTMMQEVEFDDDDNEVPVGEPVRYNLGPLHKIRHLLKNEPPKTNKPKTDIRELVKNLEKGEKE